MTDHPEPLSSGRPPWRRNPVANAGAPGSAFRNIPRNPVLLIGAAILGVVGVLAWRNRDRIAEKAAPMIEDAKTKGQELIDEAKVRGQELIEDAKAATQALSEKAARARRGAAAEKTTPELH